ncbi:MAG: hypothetical protein HY890_02885 [Deltaproteobacteria bacterium]|nr:hypothetical protein [Deltaproteobacteria bacterium]
MLTETGTLPNGVEYEGKTHRGYELREQLVSDAVEILESRDKTLLARAEKSDSFFNVCVMAKRIVRIGSIPKESITPDVVMNMTQGDFNEFVSATRRMEERRRRFRAEDGTPAEDGNSAPQPGVHV